MSFMSRNQTYTLIGTGFLILGTYVGIFKPELLKIWNNTLTVKISLTHNKVPLDKILIVLKDTLSDNNYFSSTDNKGRAIFGDVKKDVYIYTFKYKDSSYSYDINVLGNESIIDNQEIKLKNELDSGSKKISLKTQPRANSLKTVTARDSLREVNKKKENIATIPQKHNYQNPKLIPGIDQEYVSVTFRSKNTQIPFLLLVDDKIICRLNVDDEGYWRFAKVLKLKVGKHTYSFNRDTTKYYPFTVTKNGENIINLYYGGKDNITGKNVRPNQLARPPF